MNMASTGTRKLGEIEARDLSYAVGRLIAAGKTTAAEVVRLAAERGDRIKALEKELAALKDGAVPVAGSATGARRPAKKAAKPKAAKKSPAAKAGKVSTRSDGRKFTTTPKVVAARRAQGQYLGYLRQVPEKGKARIRAIVKEKGVPAAVVEMKKMLAKAKRSGKTAPTKKATPAKAGTVIKRKDGRTFTNTAKAIAAHKLQGQYIGHLGHVPAKEKERFRNIAHEKGVAAAVAALKKRMGKA